MDWKSGTVISILWVDQEQLGVSARSATSVEGSVAAVTIAFLSFDFELLRARLAARPGAIPVAALRLCRRNEAPRPDTPGTVALREPERVICAYTQVL
jgi:hypothetical protein